MSLWLLENLKFILIGMFDILGFCVRAYFALLSSLRVVLYKDFNFYT